MCFFNACVAFALAGMCFMPESPLWLSRKMQPELTLVSLKKLRKGDVSIEAHGIQSPRASPDLSGSRVIQASIGTCKKALLIGIGLMFFQQFSGVNAIIMYTKLICEQAGLQD